MLNKDSIKTLVANSLYSFHDEILKDEFATKKYVDELVNTNKTTMCTDEEIDNMLNEVLGGDYSGN